MIVFDSLSYVIGMAGQNLIESIKLCMHVMCIVVIWHLTLLYICSYGLLYSAGLDFLRFILSTIPSMLLQFVSLILVFCVIQHLVKG